MNILYGPGWRRVVYRLLYPGVLGSMIFDLMDPLRDFSWKTVCLILIAIIFVLDYIHMTVNLGADRTPPPRDSFALMDLLIASALCASYVFISQTTAGKFDEGNLVRNCVWSLVFLLVAQSLIFLYERDYRKRVTVLQILPPLVAAIAVLVVGFSSESSLIPVLVPLAIGIVMLMYCFRVFSAPAVNLENRNSVR